MSDFERLVEAIAAAIKTQKRDDSIKKIFGESIDPKVLEKLEDELWRAESFNALYGNDPAFKDWIRTTLKKYLNNEWY